MTPLQGQSMKTLATHPDLVRAWLLAVGSLPMPSLPPAPPGRPAPPPAHPRPSLLPPYRC
ncbi:hypothetical protein [Massilia sp. KIM]|uniref:hypothetical protein n=1 Tax=Massilia sp. KIM TaxID=1955422 RepID=UPI00117F7180|nr:hypothetical protein [Massilia sp. KIM]